MSGSILERIIAHKREELEQIKKGTPLGGH